MLKNLKELYVLVGALIVGTSRSLADGRFDFKDIGNYIQAFLTGEPAIDGIGEIPGELGEASRDEKADAIDDFEASISGEIDEEDAADIAAIFGGIQGGVALASRKKKTEMLTKFTGLLNSGVVEINTPMVLATPGEWTVGELETLLETYETLNTESVEEE